VPVSICGSSADKPEPLKQRHDRAFQLLAGEAAKFTGQAGLDRPPRFCRTKRFFLSA
jgi:hypothetical protein